MQQRPMLTSRLQMVGADAAPLPEARTHCFARRRTHLFRQRRHPIDAAPISREGRMDAVVGRTARTLATFHRVSNNAHHIPSARRTATHPRSSVSKTQPGASWTKFLFSHVLKLSPRVIAVSLAFHITVTYVISYNPCTGISMLPTFNSDGDCVLTSKWHRRGRGVQIGDIVSYEHPVKPGGRAIKRVIGLEGDFVLRDTPGVGSGVMVQVSSCLLRIFDPGVCWLTTVQVPKGHCWIASDNLKYGYDSRHFGPLPLALIKGKVIQRFSPWYRPVDMGVPFIASTADDGVE